jgi:aspartate racemase
MVGGIGPESTVDYYRLILKRLREQAGAQAPGVFINSVNVERLLELAAQDDPTDLVTYLADAVGALARAGAELAFFAANTPHVVFDLVHSRVPIPLVSIVRATCQAARAQGLRRLGLLGTRFTMEGRFYQDVLASEGITVVVPDPADLEYVHEKYASELVPGTFTDETRAGMMAVIDRLRRRDAIDGVILGGTELPLLLREVHEPIPFLDTARIHVDAIVNEALHG